MQRWEDTPDGQRGARPILRRLTTTDPTTEALGPILAANQKSAIIIPDEMTKWSMGMDQYKGGRGGDRPFYLSAWNGEPIYIDRARQKNEPIAVPRPFLTVVGGMTPDMLSTLPESGGRDDGFLARLLFAFPEKIARRYSEEGIPDVVANAWDELIQTLWKREMVQGDGLPTAGVVQLSPEAKIAWADWCHAHYAEQEADDFPSHLEGAWGKLEAYAGRLALILHMMHLAADPAPRATEDVPEMPRRIIEDAARLVTYFKAQARRVHSLMGGKGNDGGEDVRALLKWIGRNGHTTFSTRDIDRNFSRFDGAALDAALRWMVGRNLIRAAPH